MNFYHLIGVTTAFALMALITVCCRGDGGPLQLAADRRAGDHRRLRHAGHAGDGRGQLRRACSPTCLLLGCGILGISIWKNWHLLNYLGFVCTYGLFLGAMRPVSARRISGA